ncbi:hypothetical protein WA026_001631 [Henosepilachna vigintioctopunctata]|uniref:Uncharacterized protein n=1 Tax=Henosepilachna vigintioctopunctata TaxID=420089 RepID=A0AAW1UQH0_9CUCU
MINTDNLYRWLTEEPSSLWSKDHQWSVPLASEFLRTLFRLRQIGRGGRKGAPSRSATAAMGGGALDHISKFNYAAVRGQSDSAARS